MNSSFSVFWFKNAIHTAALPVQRLRRLQRRLHTLGLIDTVCAQWSHAKKAVVKRMKKKRERGKGSQCRKGDKVQTAKDP